MISQERCRILLPGGGVCISLNDVQTERMQIGFIGAGKVGVSLGKYFKEKGRNVGGYYSLTRASAAWAAEFTQTTCYKSLEEIISSCGMILFTVPDSAIAEVWQQAKPYVSGKVIGHCSGLYSSDIFSDWDSMNCHACSVHPLAAISSKENAWRELSGVLFTLEGDSSYVKDLETFFHSMGNRTRIISKEDKIKYHAAAAISSNYMTALFSMSEQLLLDCGFAQEEARSELYALAKGNLDHILTQGCVQSLTGPLERNDCATVEKHISALNEKQRKIYTSCAEYLTDLAQRKHPDRDYAEMRKLCRNGEHSPGAECAETV